MTDTNATPRTIYRATVTLTFAANGERDAHERLSFIADHMPPETMAVATVHTLETARD
jgi:hypothetical protein